MQSERGSGAKESRPKMKKKNADKNWNNNNKINRES